MSGGFDAPPGRPTRRERRVRRSSVKANIAARVIALASLAVATVLVARVSGPSGVGVFALLRVLPGLLGVLLSGGLPTGVAYFLARPSAQADRGQLRYTIIAMAGLAGIVGTLAWIGAAPALTAVFFNDVPVSAVAWAGVTVFTQLLAATAKGCSQGLDDLPGANRVIVFEEFMFLPAYGALYASGIRGYALLIGGLVLADVLTAAVAWRRLARRGYFREASPPSPVVAREVWWYGTRGQVGGVLSLLNLRLDFVLLGVFAGTAVVGSYAVASKFAELLRLAPLAITYVLYPRFSRSGDAEAAEEARTLLRPAAAFTAVAAVPLALAAGLILPLVYGDAFQSAIVPAHILLVGLAVEGAASVVTAFLYGTGRPGLNSIAMGVGVLVTVVLDAVLIPRSGATGAAIASSAAYLTSTAVLLAFFWSLTRPARLSWLRPAERGAS
jgi:O-antigen/teichoic acid export membrane protein